MTDGAMTDPRLLREVERFLFNEAAIVDELRFQEWFALLAEDIRYYMPVPVLVAGPGAGRDNGRSFAYYDESKSQLEARIQKLDSGFSWSEIPQSRTRHMLTNIRITDIDNNDELTVECNFVIYRFRVGLDEDRWVGRRVDRLIRGPQGWVIKDRRILLDQPLLAAKNSFLVF